ncbi:MAG: hypothetical protein RLZZ241_529 [Bacteroidota bacterium]
MHRYAVLFCCFLAFLRTEAQYHPLLFGFDEVPQALLINPGARVSYNWYSGIPLVSGIWAQARSSKLTYNDLFANDGIVFTNKVRLNALYNLTSQDEFGANLHVDLINFGFRGQKNLQNFYSLGMYLEADHQLYWPEDLVALGWDGNLGPKNSTINLGHLNLQGYLRNVLHVGMNRNINKYWTAGIRLKVYSGIYNFTSTRNSGFFITDSGTGGLQNHTLIANMRLQTSGLEGFREIITSGVANPETEILNSAIGSGLLGGNLGLGVDVGFSHKLSDQLWVTGSLLDWGFSSNKTTIRNVVLRGQQTLGNVNPIQSDALSGADSAFWQNLVDQIKNMVPIVENRDSYLTFNPTRFYGAVRYNFGNQVEEPKDYSYECSCIPSKLRPIKRSPFRNAIGTQVYAITRPKGPQTALSVFYQRQLTRKTGLKATYTVDKFSKTNLGLGVNFQVGPFECYLLADNFLACQNLKGSKLASFQFGLNILSW